MPVAASMPLRWRSLDKRRAGAVEFKKKDLGVGKMAHEGVASPSDRLPKTIFDNLLALWSVVTFVLALPAIWTGFARKGWALRAVVLGLLLVALAVPVLQLPWSAFATLRALLKNSGLPAAVVATIANNLTALVILSIAYVLIISMNRAWCLIESRREHCWSTNRVGEADKLPDLRRWALSGLLLLPILPLWLNAFNRMWCATHWSCIFSETATIPDYAMFVANAALGHIIPLDVGWSNPQAASMNAHLLPALDSLVGLTVQFGLVFTLLQLNRIRKTSQNAVDALSRTPDSAIAVGRRILPMLEAVVTMPSPASGGAGASPPDLEPIFYKNAAIAIGRIGGSDGIEILAEMTRGHGAQVTNRVVQALSELEPTLGQGGAARARIVKILSELDAVTPEGGLVRTALNAALETYGLKSVHPEPVPVSNDDAPKAAA
jgi:hypothetical protein